MVFDLPVKPYVKKYLLTIFEGKSLSLDREFIKKFGNVILYTSRDVILDHLLILMKENNYHNIYDDLLPQFNESIKIELPDNEVFFRNSRHLTARVIVKFNAFIETTIREEIEAEAVRINGINQVIDRIYESRAPKMGERTLQRHGVKKVSRKETIEAWMDKYGMDESDIAYETLKKIFYRKEIEAGLRKKPDKKSKKNLKNTD